MVSAGVAGLMVGSFYVLGVVFAISIGLDVSEVALFMSSVVPGGLAFQLPMGVLADRGIIVTSKSTRYLITYTAQLTSAATNASACYSCEIIDACPLFEGKVHPSLAPLPFTWNAIVIPIHFCIGAVSNKIGRFSTRSHLRAIRATITPKLLIRYLGCRKI